MLVSVIVGLLNEEKYLPKLIEDFKRQTYPKSKIELIFIDGMSTDDSWQILENFKSSNSDFYNILLLKNPKKILSAGMNIGIKEGNGYCFLKVDCHSHIADTFVENNVKVIESGEYVCGGPRPNIIENDDNFSKTLLLVEENMFGSGVANYRKESKVSYVNSVFQGMYRREVFENVGLLDELVGRVEDNELHYRIRKYGYKIRYSNSIYSEQYTRPNLKRMLKQKYSNGYWIGKVSHVYPACFSIFHYVPFLFVIAIAFSLILSVWNSIFLVLLFSIYGLLIFLVSLLAIRKNKFNIYNLLMPFLIFFVHISYGIGTFVGLIKGFNWKKWYKSNRNLEYL
ncbi:glycosyltransferase family 2 protein [Gemella sp. GH3]|uniref:glycosyltransferase family 2 protein n=1 Tax=unclassified Gemella TaxID=2624949 RepID=UPI0015CF9931|nr:MULTISPECIES: glycosyltransferase family 2 protein [unclassified Gemella]MBF0713651.1 glycosyltransferase family 2 protein [Gemella sp. GH3.1]NYS50603.1 glycosyltransferase family 2 protein [Gemella sp. GH3]